MADKAVLRGEEWAEFVGKFIDAIAPHYGGVIHLLLEVTPTICLS
jgi:hypothetical protein